MRAALGETGVSVGRMDSLPEVSTTSLEALRAYTEGEWAWTHAEWIRARDSWLRAVELDSAFALAHLSLATFMFVHNDPAVGRRYLATAQRFAARLTERERLQLDYEVERRAGNGSRALGIARTIAARYPSPTTLSTLGVSLMQSGLCSEAIPVFERAVAMAPGYTFGWINLATCHNANGSIEPALEAYRQAERTDSTALIRDNINQEWGQAFLKQGRVAAAESAFARMLRRPDPGQRARGYRSLGYLAMYRGRYQEAVGLLGQATSLARGTNASVTLLRNLVISANVPASAGQPSLARTRLDEARQLLRAEEYEALYLEHVGAGYLRLGRVAEARDLLRMLGTQSAPANQIDSAHYRRLGARIALAASRYRRALELLDQAPPQGMPPTALWAALRGEAYDGLGKADSALAAFRAAREVWNFGFEGQEEWVRTSYRIGELAERAGDSALARTAYSELVDRWQAGDATLPELVAARQRLGRLQSSIR